MRYTMKQKWFGLLSDFYITDEAGNEKFYVKCNKGFMWDSFSFQDTQGNELLLIEQSSTNYYDIKRDGKFVAKLWKSEGWISRGIVVTLADDSEIKVEGTVGLHEYTFTRRDNSLTEIAKVSKAWIALTDTYGVEINEGEDDTLVLACVVLLDVWYHSVEAPETPKQA